MEKCGKRGKRHPCLVLGPWSSALVFQLPARTPDYPESVSCISCCVVIGIGIFFFFIAEGQVLLPSVLALPSSCQSCQLPRTANGVKINLIECEMKFVLTHTNTSTHTLLATTRPLPFSRPLGALPHPTHCHYTPPQGHGTRQRLGGALGNVFDRIFL